MKINSIYIKNINSLRGEHRIDFDAAPLRHAGLIAITGNTGAGKSTLLDAITLALYSMVPRFPQQISTNEIQKMGSIVTHFESEAIAEITYTILSKTYRSKWSIAKTRNNTWPSYKMELTDVSDNETILSSLVSEVQRLNESLIGLNFEQFKKSILLAQGDFAEFLKAKPDKRGELLEKITGTFIYREIGKKAYAKNKGLEDERALLQLQLSNLNPKDKEELTAMSISVQKLSVKVSELASTIKQYQEKLQLCQALNLLNKQVEITENEVKSNQLKADLLKPQLARFAKHESLSPYRDTLTTFQNNAAKIRANELELSIKNKLKESLDSNLKASFNQLGELLRQDVNEANWREAMRSAEKIFGELLHDLKELEKEGKAIGEKFKVMRSDARISELATVDELNTISQYIDKEQFIISELKQKYKSNLQDETLGAQIEQLSIRKNLLENLSIAHNKKSELETDISNNEVKIKNFSTQYKMLIQEISKLDQAILEADKKHKLSLSLLKLNDFKHLVCVGEACPLCGEVVSKETMTYSLDAVKSELQKQELSAQLKTITQQSSELNAKTKSLQELNASKAQEVIKLKSELDKFPISIDEMTKELGEITPAIQLRKKHLEDQVVYTKSQARLELATVLLTHKTELDATRVKYAEIKKQVDTQYGGQDFLIKSNSLQDEITKVNTELVSCTAEIAHITKEVIELKSIQNSTERALSAQLSTLGFTNIQNANTALLSDNEYQQIKADQTNLQNKVALTNANLDRLRAEQLTLAEQGIPAETADELSELIKSHQELSQAHTLSIGSLQNELLNQKEIKKQSEHYSKAITTLDISKHRWQLLAQMIGDAQGKTFANFAQSLTLEYLINLANERLQKMNDRYLLSDNEDSELEIIDLHFGSERRNVRTLSGGESFIVSLALALSLSDLSSQNHEIGSLFIDEGFGTLDPDTLEVAIQTLEKLQSESDKTIAIISHVDSLKERISTQISVERNTQDYSQLVIKG